MATDRTLPDRGRRPAPRPAGEVQPRTGGGGFFGRVWRFIQESWAELHKVEWPTQNQVVQGTVDTHDVGPQVRQQHGRERHGTDPTDLDHTHIRERALTGSRQRAVDHGPQRTVAGLRTRPGRSGPSRP